ncbi:hypothetical protein, partial [Desulfobacterium sp. N47]|uniref:hypothetical protein n=1 Tax=Desulfobacterium sp. N47 TaxID=3115210 RepID=UPI003F49FB5E
TPFFPVKIIKKRRHVFINPWIYGFFYHSLLMSSFGKIIKLNVGVELIVEYGFHILSYQMVCLAFIMTA